MVTPNFTKGLAAWKTYPAIPDSGIAAVHQLLQSGPLHRYHGNFPELTQFEQVMAAYVGKPYAVGVNSCGSAIFIALKALGVKPADPVLTNALTFQAVPSSITHAGGCPIYVETTPDLTIDVADLIAKAEETGAAVLVLSHMRGKVADLDAVYAACDQRRILVVEDCAHALGLRWKGTHVGYRAAVSCFSFQSHKVLNAGEGGLLATADPDWAAQAILYAGCFETLHLKHTAAPPEQYFDRYRNKLPNYSLRITNLAAALLMPQLEALEERIAAFNARFQQVAHALESLPGLRVIYNLPDSRPVNDCIQFQVPFAYETALSFVQQCRERGVLIALFGATTNARNFRSWKFADIPDLPKTERIIASTCDMSLPAVFDDSDWQTILAILQEVYRAHCTQPDLETERFLLPVGGRKC